MSSGVHGIRHGGKWHGQNMKKSEIFDKSRRFYENEVAPLIHRRFCDYENRIAVGIAGEGSDCFGYDDQISRDHDFGTGVCLWIPEEDFSTYGFRLSIAYNELADRFADGYITDRIRERRGVLGIHTFYSDILSIDCDTEHCAMSDAAWRLLDHDCLATAVNGEVFRDDLGVFGAFRELLLGYYPDRIWRERIADGLHLFSQCLQVNYARCMTRGDVVAAQICRSRGIEEAMRLYFLLHRRYSPYYKWTFRALTEIDGSAAFSELIRQLAVAPCDVRPWQSRPYRPDVLNRDDVVVRLAEDVAAHIVRLLRNYRLAKNDDPYLEVHVNGILQGGR